jgi:hypothetical protein
MSGNADHADIVHCRMRAELVLHSRGRSISPRRIVSRRRPTIRTYPPSSMMPRSPAEKPA